ncbi:MAG: ACT domain-containing protein [Candidatus Omnitrophica bacterium]|nr:ACT domain-containing protein [Candidatus Omnitrophota bacterium]
MAKCTKEVELIITTPNKVGMLAEVTSAIADEGVNIAALCAYEMEGKAVFMLITDNSAKAKKAAETKGWKTEENDVVMVEVTDKIGAAKEVAARVEAKGINLQCCYGTTCGSPKCSCKLILRALDPEALIAALS